MKFGTDPRKLARRHDPSTSHEAAGHVNTARWEKRVYIAVCKHKTNGATQDQIIDMIHNRFGSVPYSTVTARFKALQDKKLITYTGEKRKGKSGRLSRVRVASKYFWDT
jgi:hypothetical protein